MKVLRKKPSILPGPYFSGQTLDDVMRDVIEAIRSHGGRINPTKGPAAELTGVLLEISAPRARLSRTETRGRPFSCLGELCWYLSQSNALDFISYYIPGYRTYADGGIIFGGYGPRLFSWRGVDQVANITALLRRKRDSRQAVVQLFDATDIVGIHSDIPCTCTLQFMIRSDELHMLTSMRSNDVYLGLPHDVFCFTMLQEILARTLSVEIGTYKHAVGSIHLYDKNKAAAERFLDEGWQSTENPMPPMPRGDPWPSIRLLLEAEYSIRHGQAFGAERIENLDPYWADLVRLLKIFRLKKDRKMSQLRALAATMVSPVYRALIERN